MRDLETITTYEMTKEEWLAFRKAWIIQYAADLVTECGMPEEDSVEGAEYQWENYCGQEGWHGRNEDISIKRSRDYT